MKMMLNLLIAMIFIGYGSLASAATDNCWVDPMTGMQCCAPSEGVTVCHLDPSPEE